MSHSALTSANAGSTCASSTRPSPPRPTKPTRTGPPRHRPARGRGDAEPRQRGHAGHGLEKVAAADGLLFWRQVHLHLHGRARSAPHDTRTRRAVQREDDQHVVVIGAGSVRPAPGRRRKTPWPARRRRPRRRATTVTRDTPRAGQPVRGSSTCPRRTPSCSKPCSPAPLVATAPSGQPQAGRRVLPAQGDGPSAWRRAHGFDAAVAGRDQRLTDAGLPQVRRDAADGVALADRAQVQLDTPARELRWSSHRGRSPRPPESPPAGARSARARRRSPPGRGPCLRAAAAASSGSAGSR